MTEPDVTDTAETASAETASAETASDGDAPAASYAEATAEIDAILTELERDDLDVDLLAAKVRRAAELLTWCRGRIRIATSDVAEAVDALGGEPSDRGDESF